MRFFATKFRLCHFIYIGRMFSKCSVCSNFASKWLIHKFVSQFQDACRFHPGTPYFHDAYKGWSCCNRKSVDFTEFLNIKGCQLSKHSNVKPIEPEKPQPKDVIIEEEPPKKIPEPVKPSALKRPSFDSDLSTLQPTIAPALKQSIDNLVVSDIKKAASSTKYEH